MSTANNTAVHHRLVEEFNKRNLAVIDEVCSPNFVLHDVSHPHWPRGLEGARKMFTVMLATTPDLQITREDIVAEGDKVVVRWTFRGTNSGKSETSATPTEEPITALAIGIYRFVEGTIEEDWGIAALCQTAIPQA